MDKRLNKGYNFLMIKFGRKGSNLSVLVKSQLCLSLEMKSEFNANHVYGDIRSTMARS